MQTPPRIASRFAITMSATPPKPPIKQIQGQGQIDEFIRPQTVSRTNDGDQRAHTSPLQRKRRINDDDDDDDDRPMVNNPTGTNAGTNQDPVLIPDTEHESDGNFGVILLPVRQPTQDQSQHSTRSRESKSRRRTQSPSLDKNAEQVRSVICSTSTYILLQIRFTISDANLL